MQPDDGTLGSHHSDVERSEALAARGDGDPELLLDPGENRPSPPRLAKRISRSLRRFITTLRMEGEPAIAEGLAAGTGLLTGPTAQGQTVSVERCPACAGVGEVMVVDLVTVEVTWRCVDCSHEWKLKERSHLPLDG